jgi:macrolide transport system ATP-binding/permease protein
MVARLTTLFGALALLLATIGLYGVTAYTAASRTVVIGIRMALGAARTGVIAMVIRGAMIQTVLGLSIGIPTSVLCARFIESPLFDMKGCGYWGSGDGDSHAVDSCLSRWCRSRATAASIGPAQALRTE